MRFMHKGFQKFIVDAKKCYFDEIQALNILIQGCLDDHVCFDVDMWLGDVKLRRMLCPCPYLMCLKSMIKSSRENNDYKCFWLKFSFALNRILMTTKNAIVSLQSVTQSGSFHHLFIDIRSVMAEGSTHYVIWFMC